MLTVVLSGLLDAVTEYCQILSFVPIVHSHPLEGSYMDEARASSRAFELWENLEWRQKKRSSQESSVLCLDVGPARLNYFRHMLTIKP